MTEIGIREPVGNAIFAGFDAVRRQPGHDLRQGVARGVFGKRHAILLELGFFSAKEINSTDGFDAVKLEFERLADMVHNEPEDAGQRRRVLWRIDQASQKLRHAGYSQRAIDTILAERFKVIKGASTIEELPTKDLLDLLKTLTSRLSAKKKHGNFGAPQAAPHTLCSPVSEDMQKTFIMSE